MIPARRRNHTQMSRKQRRKERSSRETARNEPVIVDQRPWYFRYGYHVGAWGGAAFGVGWYAIFEDWIGLIIGVIVGPMIGILLGRQRRHT